MFRLKFDNNLSATAKIEFVTLRHHDHSDYFYGVKMNLFSAERHWRDPDWRMRKDRRSLAGQVDPRIWNKVNLSQLDAFLSLLFESSNFSMLPSD